MNLNVDTMTLNEIKEIVKMLARNLNHERDRINNLQKKILELEMIIKDKAHDI